MLWLAGLLGIVSVGATSLVLHQPEVENEPEEDEELPEQPLSSGPLGDMFDFLPEVADTKEEAGASDVHPSAYFSPDEDYDVFDSLDEGTGAAEISPSQVLQEIVEDPRGADLVDAEGHTGAPIMLWDWIAEGEPSEVLDYDARTDSLMLVWDDLADGAEEPQVRVEQDPFDPEVMHVLMNEKSVAEIYGDPELTNKDITVIPLSSALIVGLEPA